MRCSRTLRWHESAVKIHTAVARDGRISAADRRFGSIRAYSSATAACRKADSLIDVDSLEATLEAHREANNARRIRLIDAGADPDVERPGDLSQLNQSPDHDQPLGPRPEDSIQAASTKIKIGPRKRHEEDGPGPGFDLRNGWLSRRMELEFIQWRQEVLKKHEKPSADVPSENKLASQMSILRRIRTITTDPGVREDIRNMETENEKVTANLMEYIGTVVEIEQSARYQHLEPWVASQKEQLGMKRLDEEISAFIDWIEPTESERRAREAVAVAVKQLWKKKTAQSLALWPIGSQTTGLAMPTSDLDFRLGHRFPEDKLSKDGSAAVAKRQAQLIQGLEYLREEFERHPDFTLILLHKSRIPVLTAQHIHTGLSVQVAAGPVTYRAQCFVRDSLKLHKNLKALFIVIKTMLDMRKLSDSYTGGLGSYSIFVMVTAALEMQARERLPTFEEAVEGGIPGASPEMIHQERNQVGHNMTDAPRAPQVTDQTAAQQLLYVLEFWSRRFNTYAFGITAFNGTLFRKRLRPKAHDMHAAAGNDVLRGQLRLAHPERYQRYLPCIQDPAQPNNDLGRSAFGFKHIQATMDKMLDRIRNSIFMEGQRLRGTRLKPKKPLLVLRNLIGRCDTTYDDTRARLELFAEGYLQSQEQSDAEGVTAATETDEHDEEAGVKTENTYMDNAPHQIPPVRYHDSAPKNDYGQLKLFGQATPTQDSDSPGTDEGTNKTASMTPAKARAITMLRMARRAKSRSKRYY